MLHYLVQGHKRHMQDIIKRFIQDKSIDQWRDTRVWGFVAFGVVVVLASWSGVRVIETNYTLQKKIAALHQQNDILHLQNENQKLQNEYYQTDTYLELSARQQFSKAAPGEQLVLVPRDVALAHAPELPKTPEIDKVKPPAASAGPTYLKHLRAWRDFVFHHTL